MGVVSVKNIIDNLAKGLGAYSPYINGTPSAQTAGAASSGFFTYNISYNSIGSTIPGTRIGNRAPDSNFESFAVNVFGTANTIRCGMLCRFYELGTLNLAATGNQFTHAGTFTSLQRTRYGQASQAIVYKPFVYVTTALTTTAAQVILKTVANTTGYVDQDGNNVVATKTFIFPSATTAAQSTFMLRLENGDSGVKDIVAIQVTTAAATGACTVFGVEEIAPFSSLIVSMPGSSEGFLSGINSEDLEPATPNAGSVTSYLGFLVYGGAGGAVINIMQTSVVNT